MERMMGLPYILNYFDGVPTLPDLIVTYCDYIKLELIGPQSAASKACNLAPQDGRRRTEMER